ncbi:MAG: diguanylate cyclase [Tepidisphaeraceae bacterium]
MSQEVLLIDDSKAIHALVRSRLADEPIKLRSAYTGQEGLEAARQWGPQLILLDVDLPDIEALEVCRQLKADPATSGIPVIFMAARISPDDRIYVPEAGAADFISKPFNPAELKARIRAALRTRHLYELLEGKAQIDLVTELWNRAYCEDRLCEQLSLARRTGQALTCILADIDHFAAINESFGRTFGDNVIRQTAATLSNATRLEDIVGRFGPDEFIFLCPATNAADAKTLATRCQEMIGEMNLSCQNAPVHLSCSFGVAGYDGGKSSLIEAAEKAVRSAYADGGNRVVVADALPVPAESALV